ncbi:50S ribosomal protein L5 [bacterium (Candidatus Howlettbacteria) CG_4_10_14_0_8_um_filter_40_9]|nr:MAG: 50S ribosomal protein L5 [bacterium (Candidatus Howlettbacteria) CG_4_10_14_0_8_um_filter_40_9]
MSSLKDLYKKEIVPKLKEEIGCKNVMEVPKISKVVLNVGAGRSITDAKILEQVIEGLSRVTGQLPKKTKAKKSIAGFKLREGMEIGAMVTLRGDRMFEFLERLIGSALPRVRDFRGIPATSFDGRGNYSFGMKEMSVFPEVSPEDIFAGYGLEISIITTAKKDEEAKALLTHLGFPFKKI